MRLSWSQDSNCELWGLARLAQVFLIEYFFFNFILQHLIDWKFDSIFFSMDLSWSHDPDLQVNQGCLGICFCFFN